MPQYSPYDMVNMLINGKPMTGRPFQFDSDIQDFGEFRNAVGEYVKPSILSTVCPDCGGGLEISVRLADPPFATVIADCDLCSKKRPLVDPFNSPVESGRVSEMELDPLLLDQSRALPDDGLTVADRYGAMDGLDDELLHAEEPDAELEEVLEMVGGSSPAASGEAEECEEATEPVALTEDEEEATEESEEAFEDTMELSETDELADESSDDDSDEDSDDDFDGDSDDTVDDTDDSDD